MMFYVICCQFLNFFCTSIYVLLLHVLFTRGSQCCSKSWARWNIRTECSTTRVRSGFRSGGWWRDISQERTKTFPPCWLTHRSTRQPMLPMFPDRTRY